MVDMLETNSVTGYPSIDRPWLKYYPEESVRLPMPECTIYEYLYENNKDHLDDVALVFGPLNISYREMFQKIDQTAAAFMALGVKRGDTVTLMVLNQPETVYIIYALNKIGAITCVVNVLSNVSDLVHYLDEGESKYLVSLDLFQDKAFEAAGKRDIKDIIILSIPGAVPTDKGFEHKEDKSFKTYSWDEFLLCGTTTDALPEPKYVKNACALVGHTGGTTGMPKGIMLTDDSINFCVFQFGQKWRHARGDKLLNLVVPFAVYGIVMNIHMPLVFGMQCILIPKVDPKTTDKLLLKYKPNHIISVPSYWNAIAESKEITDLSYLKIAGAGGSKMENSLEISLNELFKRTNANIHFMNGYGMSEVGSIASGQSNDCAELGSVGIPLMHNIITAFDIETQKELKQGEEGELCIYSPSTMLGYINNEQENNLVMRKHDDGRVWIHTGDLGYISEKGSVFITGRIKRIYITSVNGTVSKIFPDRVEKILSAHPDVSNCCVVCKKGSNNTFYPIAYVVLKAGEYEDLSRIEQDLSWICKRDLPEYSQPAKFLFVDSLPLTSIGKIDYRKLEEMAQENKSI
jgi:long-chain acyl-CoA synthetase